MTIGWRTLDVGEKALVYNHEGHARIEQGPKRLFLWRETYHELQKVAATQTEYLQINYKDGRQEHKKGPCIEFVNPVVHASIHNRKMESLDANEALVVYSPSDKGIQASRRIEFGPTLFVPKPNEWLHEFVWHGTDPNNKTRFIPKSNRFSKLRIIPDQFYYNVDEIRTSDDALIRVKLMMFYELRSLEKMSDCTADPIADFINCLCADVIAYAAKKTYLQFIEQAGELSDLDHYPMLMHRCKEIGYTVTKVVFRGYYAHDELQQMHDQAISRRTELKLSYEKEEQEQALVDCKLNADMSRMDQEQKLQIQALKKQQELAQEQLLHQLTMKKQKHEQTQLKLREYHLAKLKTKQFENEQHLTHFRNLHKLGVNVNQLLLARSQRPKEIVEVIKDKDVANVHLHYS